jgi:hypothetical protein
MVAKKRKPGFDLPIRPSDTGWVQQSEASLPTPAATPIAPRNPSRTYTRGAVADSPRALEETKMDQTNTTTPGSLLVNGVKVLGEVAVVPGASLIVDGEVKSGIVHAAGGLLGLAVLGPVLGPLTWLAMGADSYSRSVAGKTIVDQFKKPKLAE